MLHKQAHFVTYRCLRQLPRRNLMSSEHYSVEAEPLQILGASNALPPSREANVVRASPAGTARVANSIIFFVEAQCSLSD